MMPLRYPQPNQDPYGTFDTFRGGITWQLDGILMALQDATIRDDANQYASLVAQACALVRPKLSEDEYARLSEFGVEEDNSLPQRQRRRDMKRRLFTKARNNLASLLSILSARGLYAKQDESPVTPSDESSFALR